MQLEDWISNVVERIPLLQHPEIDRLQSYFNIFAILGPRGAGKSTLLFQLYERCTLNNAKFQTQFSKAPKSTELRLLVLPPIDCSALSLDAIPGVALLTHLQETLKGLRKSEAHDGEREWATSRASLNKLISSYLSTSPNYQDLCQDLSSSLADFGAFVTKGQRDRLNLRRELGKWFEEDCKRYQYNAVLVLLDDFDLVPAETVQAWLHAFQDELHQLRLIFVLTADYYRLEYLSWNAQEQVDDKTGRALLSKVIAPQNRQNLQLWPDSNNFVTHDGCEETLGELLLNDLSVSSLEAPFSQIATSLLPRWPRGLLNLYESLERRKVVGGDGPRVLRELLGDLASSRSEPLLARRLRETPIEEWVRILQLNSAELAPEDWQLAVRRALDRLRVPRTGYLGAAERLAAIPGLKPVPSRDDMKIVDPAGISHVDVPEWWTRDPSWKDPLRHDLLRILPLRDADEPDRGLWLELLVGLGMKEPQQRFRFASAWPPVRRRLGNSRFAVEFPKWRLRRFFENAKRVVNRYHLSWLRWLPGDGPGVNLEIGWAPMMAVLRGEREDVSSDLLAYLLINAAILDNETEGEKGTPSALLGMLPGDIAGQVLFAEGLSRCPWSPLSTALGWDLTTHLGLSSAFTRTAYVWGLVESGCLETSRLSESQRYFLGILQGRKSLSLLAQSEEAILESLLALFTDDLPEKLGECTDSLSRAASAFLESALFTSITDLVAMQPEVRGVGMRRSAVGGQVNRKSA